MVVFDANFLMIALRPNIPASVDSAKERIAHLLDELQRTGERIVVPTPVLTELLVRAEKAASVYLDELQKSSRFKLAPFGARAAVEVAAVISSAITRGNKKDGSAGTWAKVNYDRQIAAIGKVEGCHTIYTDDEDLGKFAAKMGMKVVTLADLPIPPSPHPLFDGIEDTNENQEAENKPENSAQLRADGSGGAGNTAGTEKEADKKS
jgi:predicted nucleic acid-binding protein